MEAFLILKPNVSQIKQFQEYDELVFFIKRKYHCGRRMQTHSFQKFKHHQKLEPN
jgi:hypothetical protein